MTLSQAIARHKWPILASVGGLGAVLYLVNKSGSANTVGAPTGSQTPGTSAGGTAPGGITEYQSATLGLQQQALSNQLTLGLGNLQNQRDIAAAQLASADARAQAANVPSLANAASNTIGNILKALTGGGGGSSGGSGGGSSNAQRGDPYALGTNKDVNMQPQPYLDSLGKTMEGAVPGGGGGLPWEYLFTNGQTPNVNPEIYGTEGYYDPNSYDPNSYGDVNPPDMWAGD